jgi:hypothetical protein
MPETGNARHRSRTMSSPRILLPHHDCRIYPGLELRARVIRLVGAGLAIHYVLTGDLSRIRVPKGPIPARADGLWRHTCFEAFIAGAETPAYREFNFSPDGRWQAYDFTAYRHGGPLDTASAPAIDSETAHGGLELRARLAADLLPSSHHLHIGLSAVLEDMDGSLSYWALRHAPGKPDFHHPDTFALEIDLRNPQP